MLPLASQRVRGAVRVVTILRATAAELLADDLSHFYADAQAGSAARPEREPSVGRRVVAATRVELDGQGRSPLVELTAAATQAKMARATPAGDAARRKCYAGVWLLPARAVVVSDPNAGALVDRRDASGAVLEVVNRRLTTRTGSKRRA